MAGGHDAAPAGLPSFENRRPHGYSATEGHQVMKWVLLSATVLMGLSAPAWATSLNDIRIDATTAGSVKSLSITQDDANLANQVSATSGGGSALPIKGPWKTISINQQGGTSKFYGSVKANGGSTNATLSALYTGGNNNHSLTIGNATAPVDPTVTIAVSNTDATHTTFNTVTDTLDGTSLNYNLALNGTDSALTNSVSATGAVTLNQGGGSYGITGDHNSVTNTVSGVTSFTHNLTVAGNTNTITNAASGGGGKTITQSITGNGNTVAMTLNATGTQAAALTVDSTSTVDYTLATAANASSATINLSNVVGAASTPAVINITQTAAANGATANLTVSGGIYTMGTALAGGAGVNVYQNSAAANLNATVTANTNGYTANFIQ
jgi:hypothetical protein